MSAALDAKSGSGPGWWEWLPVGVGLLALYLPLFHDLATTIWRSDEYAHGPLILGVAAWLAWRKRSVLAPAATPTAAPRAGISVLVLGLLLYVLGRSQDITIFAVGALLPVLAGALLTLRGWPTLRALWFPIAFLVFMVPLPAPLVDALTGPLKQQVSQVAEQVLYTAGYPIARAGVMLTIGQYQLLVADACSGLNSMFSLSALGLLYLYLARRTEWLHNAVILACILPIAFVANIVRTILLVLITYHFGDAAGQGFLHGAAGIALLLVALCILLVIDGALARIRAPRPA